MNNEQLIASISEFAASKNIDKPVVIQMLQEVFQHLIIKKFGSSDHFDIIINPNKGDLQIWRSRVVVPDAEYSPEEHGKIALSDAKKIEPDFDIGEEVAEEVDLSIFGRRSVVQALQLFMQKKHVIEKNQLYEQYARHVGKLITAEVIFASPRYALLHDEEKNELFLPKSEQLPRDWLKKGMHVRAIVHKVEETQGRIRIVLSRASTAFILELLSSEIREIMDGIVVIKGIARIPGVKTKIAVSSYDDRIDAVGACIGPGGRRIQSISREYLSGERIDVIPYTEQRAQYIKRILGLEQKPNLEESDKGVTIYVSEEEMKQAVQNARFARQILGTHVHIKKHAAEEDVLLEEFTNEISLEVINQLKKIGMETAKNVLRIAPEELINRTGLAEATIVHLYQVLRKEFEL